MAKKLKNSIFRKKKTFGQKFFDFFRGFDFYGKNIVLTYKGDDRYRTHVGGISSCVVGLIVITYVLYLFQVMFTKNNTSFLKTSFLNDILGDVQIHYPAKNDVQPNSAKSQFDFAFRLTTNGIDYLAEPTAFSYKINLVKQIWVVENGVSKIQRTKTPLEYEICGETNLNYENIDEMKRLGIDKYYCLKDHNYSIAGSFFSPTFHYLEIKLQK